MRIPLSLALILAAGGAAAQAGKVHPDPAHPQPGFKPHQLSFETPKDEIARDEFRSEPFYAVILKSVQRCGPIEKERAEIQKLFPRHKVFGPLTDCDDSPEDTIFYTNVNPKVGFIAVWAGGDLEQAEKFFATVKQLGLFPGANLRRMQAVLGYT
jgi:hypothetical protein